MFSEEHITAIVSALFGGGALSGVGGWLLRGRHTNRDERRTAVHSNELAALLEVALRKSPTLKSINEKLNRDCENIHDMQLEQLRQTLFRHPFDQNSHKDAIKAGEKYARLGGNSTGHTRLQKLAEDYERRIEYNDWDYTPGHHPGEGGKS